MPRWRNLQSFHTSEDRERERQRWRQSVTWKRKRVPSCKAYPRVWWVGRERSDIFGGHMTRQLEPASPEFLHPLLLLFTNIKSRLHSRRGHRLLLNDIFSPLHIGLAAPTSLSLESKVSLSSDIWLRSTQMHNSVSYRR